MPKKNPTVVAKCANHLTLLLGPDGKVLFFQHRDGAWFPTLRLVHEYPALGRRWQVGSKPPNCNHSGAFLSFRTLGG